MSNNEHLGRFVVTLPTWRWLPGMLAVVPPEREMGTGYLFRVTSDLEHIPDRAYPDLTDSPTLGGLLRLARDAWGDPLLGIRGGNDGESIYFEALSKHFSMVDGDTEGEALVNALKYAPDPEREPLGGWVKTQGDGVAPDPRSERFRDAAWSLRYGPNPDLYAASVMDGYATLVTHSLGREMLQRIRKAAKEKA